MKKIIAIAILTLLATALTDVTGQIVPRIVNKRVKSAEKSSEEKIGREVDKAIGKLFGLDEEPAVDTTQAAATPSSGSTPRSPGIGQRAMMNAMGLSEAANVKPDYEFDGFIDMEVTESIDGEEREKTVYTTYIDSESLDYGMVFREHGEEGTSTIIFDTENSLMLTLAEEDGEKSGFAVNYTPEQAEAIADEFEGENAEMEEGEGASEEAGVKEVEDADLYDPYKSYKTGKTKKILGYKCDEYVMDDEKATVTMWVTDELSKETKNTYMQNSSFAGMFMHAYNTNGTVMEYIVDYKNEDHKTVMLVTGIDMNKRNTISTRGYNIISMGAMMEDDGGEDIQDDEPGTKDE
jgi:hypothetical protein